MSENRPRGTSARGHRGLRLLLRLMCAVCVAGATAPLTAHEQGDNTVRALTAIRATPPPRIDGVLDDAVRVDDKQPSQCHACTCSLPLTGRGSSLI